MPAWQNSKVSHSFELPRGSDSRFIGEKGAQVKNHPVYLCLLMLTAGLMGLTQAVAIPAQGQKLMIAGPSPEAISVGTGISKRGGNVVDVAVGVALSLAVTHPYYGALGGGGFALIKINGTVQALDFRETAPKATSADFYLEKAKTASTDGPFAIGVPGIPAGLWALHQKYGKLHWSELFLKPIELASKGHQVSGEWAQNTQKTAARFNEAGKKYFLIDREHSYKPGDIMKQPELAKLLKEMSNRGIVPFYQGLAAQDMVETVHAAGGVLSLDDLKSYKVRWLEPLTTEFNGYKIYLMPPPSSGGVVIMSALKLAQDVSLPSKKYLSVDELHTLAEIEKLAFRGRSLLGDPDFGPNPIKQLTSDSYLKTLASKISSGKSVAVESMKNVTVESLQTTHFSVMDDKGNTVAMTVTLNGSYGSGIVSDKFGIVMNNEMDDFTTRPGEANQFGLIQGQSNSVAPGKRPISSMSPTIVEKDGRTVLSLGAPGGPRIISAVLQVLYRSLQQGLDIDQAIQAPRIHHQFLPDILYVDATRFAPETLDGLKSKGHVIEEASTTGKVYGVYLSDSHLLEGAFDARGEGAAGGY